jgi:hypothetical protein
LNSIEDLVQLRGDLPLSEPLQKKLRVGWAPTFVAFSPIALVYTGLGAGGHMSREHAPDQEVRASDEQLPQAEALEASQGARFVTGKIPPVIGEFAPDQGNSPTDGAYANSQKSRRLGDMRPGKDFDGVGGGNVLKNAFWKARYDGTLEFLEAARDEMQRRVQAAEEGGKVPPGENYWLWPATVVDLLWDVKKLHDNAAGAEHRDVDMAKVRSQLAQWPSSLLARDERDFIRAGIEALAASGAAKAGKQPELPQPESKEQTQAQSKDVVAQTQAPTAEKSAEAQPPVQVSGAPVTIHYIAGTNDSVMAIDRALTFGEVVGHNAHEMVEGIIAKANGHPIGKLTLTGHGRGGSQQIGEKSSLSVRMSAEEKRDLARLKPLFASNAEVVLHGCEVASDQSGEKLLRELAIMWGVPVRAAVPYQRLTPGLEGTEKRAIPDGHGGATLETSESSLNEFSRDKPSFSNDNKEVAYWDKAPPERWEKATVDGRYDAITTLLGGYTNHHEGEIIIKLFQTAAANDRRELYRLIEGHPWSGDFKHGWFVDDDGLANSLTYEQMDRLKALLNQQ